MTETKWKRGIDYYAIKAISLEREVDILTAERDAARKSLELLLAIPKKKHSKYFVVFKGYTDGSFFDPKIVKADSPEEALCPEGCEEPTGDFCHRLYDQSEYKDI